MTDVGPAESAAPLEPVSLEPESVESASLEPESVDPAPTASAEDSPGPDTNDLTQAADAAYGALAPTALETLDLSPEQWRIVAVAAVEMELPSANPVVVLHEAQDPWRELRIPVGMPEGIAIAFAFRGIDTPRPLTHELVTDIFDRHSVGIEAVRITVRRGQQYFAEIDTTSPRGRSVLPCRPSDAIALALRQRLPTPILAGEWVFTGADAPSSVSGPAPPDATGPSA